MPSNCSGNHGKGDGGERRSTRGGLCCTRNGFVFGRRRGGGWRIRQNLSFTDDRPGATKCKQRTSCLFALTKTLNLYDPVRVICWRIVWEEITHTHMSTYLRHVIRPICLTSALVCLLTIVFRSLRRYLRRTTVSPSKVCVFFLHSCECIVQYYSPVKY